MNPTSFFAHHGIVENPFGAEEARHDPVYERLVFKPECAHPEFDKVIGTLDHPHAAIVFGEKGAGKTALRLLIGKKIAQHNEESPKRRVLLVPYDDLNPVLDLVARNRGGPGPDALLERFRLPDHQDAMLGIGVTKFLDAIMGTQGDEEAAALPADAKDRLRRLPRERRVELAVLSALYYRPRGGNLVGRWQEVRRRLKLGWRLPFSMAKAAATAATVFAAGLFVTHKWIKPAGLPDWATMAAGIAAAVALLLWLVWLWRHMRLWNLVRKIRAEAPAIDRTAPQLRQMLRQLRPGDRANQPWPQPGGDGTNARYELTRQFIELLRAFDHAGMIVLIDRVDEPTLVAGKPERMRALIWPLLESKFLQQDGVGVKMLLPIELRYLVRKEGSDFFQEARLDKQSVVDRLAWSGATLYDLCTARMRACHKERVGEEDQEYRVPRFIVDLVRKEQAQRVSELQRGLSPG
jgi:hypothetical protein